MVLKVVRGKILETLELSRGLTAFVFTRIDRLPKNCQLSKIVDYLVDNRCPCMLSEGRREIKGKAVVTADQFQFGNAALRVCLFPAGPASREADSSAALESAAPPKILFPLDPKLP